jgi:uncharacterized membrane protein
MRYDTIALLLFEMFFYGITGWILETVQESLVRKQFVNKGFFTGPFVPCHAIGGIAIYWAGSLFKPHPVLVFFLGAAICTLIEYLVALFLENCFKVKCWDYRTYPHTKWCHFQGRICLTISIFFGVMTLLVVYFYHDFLVTLAGFLGVYLWPVDSALILLFLADAVFSIGKLRKAGKMGRKIRGWAVFTDTEIIERAEKDGKP